MSSDSEPLAFPALRQLLSVADLTEFLQTHRQASSRERGRMNEA